MVYNGCTGSVNQELKDQNRWSGMRGPEWGDFNGGIQMKGPEYEDGNKGPKWWRRVGEGGSEYVEHNG